jgi:hypothetical protein
MDKPQEKIQAVLALIKAERDPGKRIELRRELAQRYVFANATEAALSTLEALQKELGTTVPASLCRAYQSRYGVCLFPDGRDAELHLEPQLRRVPLPDSRRGHTQAAAGCDRGREDLYRVAVGPQHHPESALAYRWLLNISHMTLGQYPDKVPKRG